MKEVRLLLAAVILTALAGCGAAEDSAVASVGTSSAATPSQTASAVPSPVALTTQQRERYGIVPSVDPDPAWCGPINSAVVIVQQVLPSQGQPLTDAERQAYLKDALALGGLPGLPPELRAYLSDPEPEGDMTFFSVWAPYEQFGQAQCPATEAYKLAHASGPKERHGGFGFVPYAIPSPGTG